MDKETKTIIGYLMIAIVVISFILFGISRSLKNKSINIGRFIGVDISK